MDQHSGTITDPLWADVIVAGLFVLLAITLFVLVDSVIRVVVRRWREAGALVDQQLADGLEEIDLARWEAEQSGGGPR